MKSCTETVEMCWDALVALGVAAVGDISRPPCLPPPPDPFAAALAAAERRDQLHAIAARDPKIRARRAREAALAAARPEQAAREVANAGAAWMADVHRAAGRG